MASKLCLCILYPNAAISVYRIGESLFTFFASLAYVPLF